MSSYWFSLWSCRSPLWIVPACFLLFKVFKTIKRALVRPSFNGKTVFITGVSSGIGETMAYKFSQLGANLIILARKQADLDRVQSNCANPSKVSTILLDLANPTKVEAELTKYMEKNRPKIDILINNAGVSQRCFSYDNGVDFDSYILNVNVLSPIAITKVVSKSMMARKSGQIVVTSSVSGLLATPKRTTYCCSKFAVQGYFHSLRYEMAAQGISVTLICPGYVQTNLGINALTVGEQTQGTTDDEIATGLDLNYFVKQAIKAIYLKENQAVIATTKVHVARYLEFFLPGLLRYVLNKKFKKQEAKLLKDKKTN